MTTYPAFPCQMAELSVSTNIEAVRPGGAGPNGEEHGVARMGCFRRSGGFSVPLFSTTSGVFLKSTAPT